MAVLPLDTRWRLLSGFTNQGEPQPLLSPVHSIITFLSVWNLVKRGFEGLKG